LILLPRGAHEALGRGVELMTSSIVWSWSLSNPRTFCALSRPSTRSLWTRPAPLTRRAKVMLITRYPYALLSDTGLQETPLPDVVPNTLSGEPSIAPPIDRPHPPRTSPVAASSDAPLSEPPAPEPEIAVVPVPRRVRTFSFLAFLCLVLTDAQLPPRRAIAQNRTASPGPANGAIIVDASPSPLPPLVPPAGDAMLGATQLPTVCELFYFLLVTHEFSHDRVMRSPYSPYPRREDSRRADEQTWASIPPLL
jgi:hypothetical protein